VAHLVALYGVPGVDGLVQRFGPTLGLARAFATGPLLFVSCATGVILLEATLRLARTRAHETLAGARN
jgi:TRAP-type C4-dicarboxylate transport system permease small subunit